MLTSENTLDFATILPDEILCSVFSFVQVNEPIPATGYDVGYRLQGSNYGWVKVTFVSHRWRKVAIEDATLWTSLTSKLGTRWLDEFVRRSKSALLIVDDGNFSAFSYAFYTNLPKSLRDKKLLLRVLTEHRDRIVSLRLHGPVHDVIEGAFIGALPTLKDVRLDGSDESTTYPVRELLDHAPHLRRLHLNLPPFPFSALDWTHATWNGLTALNLMLNAREAGILTPTFLDALRRMHSLEELIIREDGAKPLPLCCDYRCSGTPSDLIGMRCLKSMILGMRAEGHAHFLRHIRPPPHARLCLASHERIVVSAYEDRVRLLLSQDAHADAPVYEQLARALNNMLSSRAEAPVFQAAHMTFTETLKETVLLGLTQTAQPSKPLDGHVLRYNEKPHEKNVNNLTLCYHDIRSSIILPVLSLSTIHTLTLENVVTTQISEICVFFPSVERLRLSVISELPRHNIRFLEDPTLLPMLRFVDMDASFFNLRTVLDCYSPQGARVVPERFIALEDTLQARWEMGLPLQVLLHVEEEVALVKDGRIERTSCRGIREDVVRESVERLESVEGVLLVSWHFDPFAM
ncbi:hypothetical protein PENSPDRAFT_759939 [Peniophora sp. CONT]|nr:hypothetical protein PENSPDRAFT_759939 [Peniophora sp. CONT]